MDNVGGTIEEEMKSQESPIFKVFWESPSGEDIEVPRGMNLGTMVEAGLIPPMDVDGDDGETVAGGGGGAAVGVFDPAAVKGAEERSAEVSELYAKVMANKANARAASEAGATHDAANSTPTPNGHVASKESGGGAKRANSWIGGIFGVGGGSEIKETASTDEETGRDDRPGAHSGLEQQDMVTVGASGATVPESGGEEEVTEMVGYDFILQDRDDKEGKVARSARALSRWVCITFTRVVCCSHKTYPRRTRSGRSKPLTKRSRCEASRFKWCKRFDMFSASFCLVVRAG